MQKFDEKKQMNIEIEKILYIYYDLYVLEKEIKKNEDEINSKLNKDNIYRNFSNTDEVKNLKIEIMKKLPNYFSLFSFICFLVPFALLSSILIIYVRKIGLPLFNSIVVCIVPTIIIGYICYIFYKLIKRLMFKIKQRKADSILDIINGNGEFRVIVKYDIKEPLLINIEPGYLKYDELYNKALADTIILRNKTQKMKKKYDSLLDEKDNIMNSLIVVPKSTALNKELIVELAQVNFEYHPSTWFQLKDKYDELCIRRENNARLERSMNNLNKLFKELSNELNKNREKNIEALEKNATLLEEKNKLIEQQNDRLREIENKL